MHASPDPTPHVPGRDGMTILFGHPCGNPNSHNAALAHFEAHRLEAFCVPWMPSETTLQFFASFSPLRQMARRLGRRNFPPLARSSKIQGRLGEIRRLVIRALGCGDEGLSYQANDWLMSTMRKESRRSAVRAVHSYEDCSLWQFREAKRLGKACIYDMPIGYYPAWEQTEAELARKFVDWLPSKGLSSTRYVRPQQKLEEMDLADCVLAPSSFVADSVRKFHPKKAITVAPYGVDLQFWRMDSTENVAHCRKTGVLRFIFVGQISLRKGIPLLLEAWNKAELRSAELHLVGSWLLNETKRVSLPRGVTHVPPVSREVLREHYQQSDVFIFPSFFEGFALVLLEALACGLPAIASVATGAADILTQDSGRLVQVGDLDSLVESLRWFDRNRDRLPAMRDAARNQAQRFTWEQYRRAVSNATAKLV